MHGEPKTRMPKDYYKNKQHENAMTAPIDIDKIRESGY